eukprot:151985-Chlamydomonas_euryale.AAC.2
MARPVPTRDIAQVCATTPAGYALAAKACWTQRRLETHVGHGLDCGVRHQHHHYVLLVDANLKADARASQPERNGEAPCFRARLLGDQDALAAAAGAQSAWIK